MSYKAWRRIQNPALVENMPTFEFAKDGKLKISELVYVCGFGATGALGLPRYYKPDVKKAKDLKSTDIEEAGFRRLGSIRAQDKVTHAACGYGFTILCGSFRNTSHTAVGFGLNTHSQIGYHAPRPGFPLEIVASPSPIFHPSKSRIVKAACGRLHSLLLDADSRVFAMGDNSLGQCGRPIKENETYFGTKQIHHIESLPQDIVSIVCGQDHSFFLTKTGQLFACGWGADGQTGLGHYDTQWQPELVKGDLEGVKIKKVSTIADTVLAVDHDGNLFGWGNSEYSQFRRLTNSDSMQFCRPVHLKLEEVPSKVVDVAAGGTMCAVLNDLGQVYVWGFGLLGVGPEVDQTSKPLLIPESLFGKNHYNPETKVTKIFASLDHFAAVSSAGDLYGWGRNRGMSLGFKHRQDQWFPMRVNLNQAIVKKVALGVDHSCVIAEKVC